MNAPRPLFPPKSRTGLSLAALAAAAGLAGCAGNPFGEHPVDPASAAAKDVARLSRPTTGFPTFASIPDAPKNLRPAAQYGRQARQIDAAGKALIAATEPGTWTLQNTDAFAEKARRDAGPALAPADPARTEADAKALRERATPPPPRAPQ